MYQTSLTYQSERLTALGSSAPAQWDYPLRTQYGPNDPKKSNNYIYAQVPRPVELYVRLECKLNVAAPVEERNSVLVPWFDGTTKRQWLAEKCTVKQIRAVLAFHKPNCPGGLSRERFYSRSVLV